mmetsp:Transcript_850/g.1325  ORF Transcript_850/g.1325 Transcript_850/m.1325 type:complete len:460 (+) Transcript_850:238-1617(+)
MEEPNDKTTKKTIIKGNMEEGGGGGEGDKEMKSKPIQSMIEEKAKMQEGKSDKEHKKVKHYRGTYESKKYEEKKEAIKKKKDIEQLMEAEECIGDDNEKNEEKMVRIEHVPYAIREENMKNWLKTFGELHNTFLIKTIWKDRQFIACFLRKKDAERAIEETKRKRWCDVMEEKDTHTIHIRWHVYTPTRPHPENKIFVGQLEPTISEEELRGAFSKFGEISDLVVLKKNKKGGSFASPKQSGFIKFVKKEAAAKAIKACHHSHLFPEKSKEPVVVRYAELKNTHRAPKRYLNQTKVPYKKPFRTKPPFKSYPESIKETTTTTPTTTTPPIKFTPTLSPQQSPPTNFSYMNPMAYFFHPMYMRYVPYPMMFQQSYFQPNANDFSMRSLIIKPVNPAVSLSMYYHKLSTLLMDKWQGYRGFREQLPHHGIVEMDSRERARNVCGLLKLENLPELNVSLLSE